MMVLAMPSPILFSNIAVDITGREPRSIGSDDLKLSQLSDDSSLIVLFKLLKA